METVSNETILKQLNWRYATKKFDSQKKVPPADWKALEQAVVLAPSSFGLQPWKVFVVTNPAVRATLRAAAYNQAQITDASHLLVFAFKKNLGPADVEHFIARICQVRGVSPESLEGYKNVMIGSIKRPADQVDAWAARQAYIGLGTFLFAAALRGIDACPMEGFDPAQFNQILGLDEKGYSAVVLAAAGYRAADDGYAGLAKVRFPHEHLIVPVA
jgi:nitroreductase